MQGLSRGMFEFSFRVAIKHVVFAFRHGGLCNKYEQRETKMSKFLGR